MKLLIGVLFLTLVPILLRGQDRFMFMDVKAHGGKHLYLSDELAAKMDRLQYIATELRVGWQTDGSKGWEHNYNYPSYGLGWYSGFIGDKQILGNPNAFYGFIIFPLTKQRKHTLVSELSLGLTYELHKFDPELNPLNDAIGTSVAVYFNYSIGGRYEFSDRWDFLYGLDITHMSNGRITVPNYGLNMGGVNVGLSYHFNTPADKSLMASITSPAWCVRPACSLEKDKNMKRSEGSTLLYFAPSTTQNKGEEGQGKRYFNSSTVLEYQHFFHYKHGVVVGVDFFYDGSMRSYGESPFVVGAHTGYDYRMSKLTIRTHLGTYLHAPKRKGGFFMRPALKYDINEKWFAQLGLKTKNGLVADWIEWGVGVKL